MAPGVRRRRRAVRRTAALLPTLFTLGNALCGFMAIFFASRPISTEGLIWTPLTYAAVFIFLGMVCDAIDGRLARLARHTSDLGAQLDSLADMVTFGVAPAFAGAQLVVGFQTPYFASTAADSYFGRAALIVAGAYVACAALRLARFNIESRIPGDPDHAWFKGLPSPGAAGAIAAIILLHQHFLAEYYNRNDLERWVPANWTSAEVPLTMKVSAIGMVAVMLLAAFAMVSRTRYVHVVSRYFRGRLRFSTLAKAAVLLLLLAIFWRYTLAGAFILYALSGPAVWLWRFVRGRRPVRASGGTAPPAG